MKEGARDPHPLARRWVRGAILVLAGALCSAAVPGRVSDPVEVLVEVRRAWNGGELEEALERLAALEESELADHVALIRARILREQGEVEAAIAAARHGLQRDPPSEVEARLHHEIAQIELEREDLLAAYREQRRAWESSRHPENSAALMMEIAQAFDQRKLPGGSGRPGRSPRWVRLRLIGAPY